MTLRRCEALAIFGLCAALTGCGNYTITFEVAEYINAWGGPTTKQNLEVDIICLGKEDVKKHPEIAEGAMKSDEWFNLRRDDSTRIADIKTEQIYSLRPKDRELRGKRLADPLISGVDYDASNEKRTRKIGGIKHSGFLEDGACIVIYGRFIDKAGLAKVAPVVIKPPPPWNTAVVIKIGEKDMRMVEGN